MKTRIILDTRHHNKSGLFPLKISISTHGKTALVPLDVNVASNHWNATTCRVVKQVTSVYVDFDMRKVDALNRAVIDWVLYGKKN